jgi:DNA end-binding protein Ku
VVVSDEELERLMPERTRDIELTRFVEREAVSPVYAERSYFLLPRGATLAYRLLATTMEKRGKAGIATFVMRAKQYLVAIVAEDGLLRAETLRFADELRTPEDIGLPSPSAPKGRALQRMKRAIDGLSKQTFPRHLLRDEHQERILALAEKKQKQHKDIIAPEQVVDAPAQSNVIDLLEVLKRSLEDGGARAEGRGARRASPARGAKARGPGAHGPRRAGTERRASRKKKTAHARA